MPNDATSPSPARHSSIDLQLCVLRNLPTPVLVLSPSRTAVFANRAAAKVLGQRDPIQSSSHALHGKKISELGIKLLDDGSWDGVLDKLVAAQTLASQGAKLEGAVHELEVAIGRNHDEKYFRILANTLTANDGVHFVLSFEQAPYLKNKAGSRAGPTYNDMSPASSPEDEKRRNFPEGLHKVSKIKQAVFNSCTVAGFVLSGDEKFYLSNNKFRETLGNNIMGGSDGCDVSSLRATLPVWDEKFERRLQPGELPATKMVRTQVPFADFRCGFTHITTGAQMIMNVSGECLYDDDTGEFLGGLCWCTEFQEYSDFLTDQMQSRLTSHETICNVMPHFVWTTTADGECDWFSRRVSSTSANYFLTQNRSEGILTAEKYYEFTGFTREESVGVGYTKAVHPDDLPILREKWESRNEGSEFELELRHKRSDGVYRWMLARACPLRDEKGNTLKWYGTNTDIHDLVMARIEAARNKMQMLSVLSHAEVNLFSIDKDMKITMAEGGMLWKIQGESMTSKSWMIGKDAIEVSQGNQDGGLPGKHQHRFGNET